MASMCYVSQSCCGCSLKQGTLMLLISCLVCTILGFLNPGPYAGIALPSQIIYFLLIVAGLYGVHKEKPGYVIPFAVLLFLGVIGTAFLFLLHFINYDAFVHFRETVSDLKDTDQVRDAMEKTDAMILGVIVFTTLFQYYCFLVVFSFYKDLRQPSKSNSSANPA